MPDIHMFGFERVHVRHVEEAFDDAPYKDALTFIQGPEMVWGVDYSKPQKFVRVSATMRFAHLDDVVARLKKLNVDIELMTLDGYIPAGA
jgi:hypothetical protein